MPKFDPPLTDVEVNTGFPNKYLRIAPVFAGGQGTVFRVDRPDGSVGALKIYAPDPGAELEERTAREVDALQNIVRPTVVNLDAFGSVGMRGEQCRFVCTTFIEGVTLSNRLQVLGAPMPLDEVARVGYDVADAIEGLWERPYRIVHRDVKPPNVMLSSSGRAVLIDLGVARHTTMDSLTVTGNSWGTQGYMSPEQALGRKALTCKSDVFALGIMLQQCLAGRHPSNGSQRVLTTGPLALTHSFAPSAPAEVAKLIDSMVLKDANRRPMPDQIKSVLSSHARAIGRPW
jgi:serine/threonine protein kinase